MTQIIDRTSLWLSVLFALTSCGEDEKGPKVNELALGPNLLLITLDTTRADRIGAYGYADADTPRLDDLASRGVRFNRAYAHVPLTLPTHASMFTGTFPPEHGIHDNGRKALGPELTTLAQIFSERGFRTGAFVSAIALDSSFGLDRGFDVYDDELSPPDSPGLRVLDRPASEVVDSALRWLSSDDRPFFAWVHFYDPHAPYSPPADFQGADPYDGELAYVDSQISRIFGWLESRDLIKDTLIVALADHGESLGEKGEHTHAALIYEGTQHIPWIMALPGRIDAGTVSEELVQQVDLMPTLMEIYDWPAPEQISGQSFACQLRAEIGKPNDVYIESEYSALNFGWSSLHGVVHEEWKYIRAPTPELYNLSIDRREEHNLASAEPARVQELDQRLQVLLDSMHSFGAEEATLAPGMAQGLSSLGYVQGAKSGAQAAPTSLINPIERIEFLELYHSAVGFANHGKWNEMIAPLEKVVNACPEAAGFHTLLGDTYRRLNRLDEAHVHLAEALELDPEYDPAHFYMGAYQEVRGDLEAASASYRRNLELRPEYVPAREALARLQREAGDVTSALEQYEKIVKLDPNVAKHWVVRSQLALRIEDSELRRTALLRAVELAKDDLGSMNYCAWALATTLDESLRDGAHALTLATDLAQRTNRRVPQVLDTLAAAQAATGNFEDALMTIQAAIGLAQATKDAVLLESLESHRDSYRGGDSLRED
ncbi:MAG: arylsulfatase A-like enzyme/Flp pilus assembly protein TadD [Planctomycetota bacterium]|jgi:arylsulfatase A-like enzyme/Flp pilus assembly protein TadD